MNRLLSGSVSLSATAWLTLLLAIFGNCSLGAAQTLTIDATSRGCVTPFGNCDNSGSSTLGAYFVGNWLGFEHRNFFYFDLSSVSQPIASATLVLTAGLYNSTDPSENYELHDVTTPFATILAGGNLSSAFADLGSSAVYANRVVTAADTTNVEIELNSSAIAAMNATHGSFGIGGSLTTIAAPKSPDSLFVPTSSQLVSQLQLTLVPEPSTLLLLATGVIGFLGRSKAR